MQEKLIMKFSLPALMHYRMVEHICVFGYKDTGNKFSVYFNGSKGYLSNIEICCEGYQLAENRIFVENLTNKDRSLRKVLVNIFHSDKNGVRVSIGKDEPQTIESEDEDPITYDEEEDGGLPF